MQKIWIVGWVVIAVCSFFAFISLQILIIMGIIICCRKLRQNQLRVRASLEVAYTEAAPQTGPENLYEMFADVERKVEQHLYRNGGLMDHVERAN